MDVKKRETTSIFKDDSGRTFQINSYDPMMGNYILMQIATFGMPFGLGEMLSAEVGSETNAKPNIDKKPMMSKSEFLELQKDILTTVEEVYESGNTSPVVRENGTYGVQDVSSALLLKLIVASLAFNFKSFFNELPSTEGLNSL